jgi:hypothetical protein
MNVVVTKINSDQRNVKFTEGVFSLDRDLTAVECAELALNLMESSFRLLPDNGISEEFDEVKREVSRAIEAVRFV